MTLGVFASGRLPHLPFGAIGPLGLHDDKWLSLELLVMDRPGVGIISQLWFGMWLIALPVRGDHDVLRPILTGWFTRLIEFCDGFCG